ncbi:hypothetical protein ACAF76_006590 [Brevibacillus sp. TJ4]|uniref:hypothetical protein n=1 Tax=Brevibacillus sp. TJ4 TaxID=3234853 RepID=UPI0037CD2266
MRKWVASVLLASLMTSSLYSGIAVSPAQGAQNHATTGSQLSQMIKKPVHEKIVFNDYQVAGLDLNGWNWVKNDEFILPPDTPLDIDVTQVTYGDGDTFSQSKVLLDGIELSEYAQAMSADEAAFRWQLPRFTIPAEKLNAGVHTLTFVATDGYGQESRVHVLFRVEAKNFPLIYPGEVAQGEKIHNGEIVPILGENGSKSFVSSLPGDWRLTDKKTGSLIKTFSGLKFTTGVLLAGEYELSFLPDDLTLFPWQATLRIGQPTLYMGTDENGQQLEDKQTITAKKDATTVQLFSTFPGSWRVSGTGQTLAGSNQFDVELPAFLAGLTVSVTFEPDQGDAASEAKNRTAMTVQIKVPGTVKACETGAESATMDLLSQQNRSSTLMIERSNLRSSQEIVKVYQDPIYGIWLGTAADHIEYGSSADDEEGPGVWAINNVVVDDAKLNWDHTGLELSQLGVGRYKINYYSKENPDLSWCGTIQLIEGAKPKPSAPACEIGDRGESPDLLPMKLHTKSGKEYTDGDRIEVDSRSLEDLEELTLSSTHAAFKGMKKVKREKDKEDRRFLYVADTVWEYGNVPFGARHVFGTSPIFSSNEVVVSYEGEKLTTIRPSRKEDEVPGGRDTLNLQSIIERDGRKGEYTVEVINYMTYLQCSVVSSSRSYSKEVTEEEEEQRLLFTVVVGE